jgi:hypothetical protein
MSGSASIERARIEPTDRTGQPDRADRIEKDRPYR